MGKPKKPRVQRCKHVEAEWVAGHCQLTPDSGPDRTPWRAIAIQKRCTTCKQALHGLIVADPT